MTLDIRKIVTHCEETRIEGGKAADKPMLMVAAAAVARNPWAGQGFVEDLRKVILRDAPPLAEELVGYLLRLVGSGEAVEAFGKSAVVGVNGEVEHASGIIHTLYFGNLFRNAVGGKSYLPFTNFRAGPGCDIQVPMHHKNDEGLRSHFLTLQFNIADAPGPDEIVIAIGASTTGRPHQRLGNRYTDMEEMKKLADA